MNLFTKILITLFLAMCTTYPAWSAADMYLKIDDIKGESKLVYCPAGTCLLEGLAVGDYALQVCDKAGNPVAVPVVLYEIPAMATREAGSGMATGKRQHKPVRVTSQPGDVVRRFSIQVSDDLPVTLQIKNLSAIKADAFNQNASRTNRLPQE